MPVNPQFIQPILPGWHYEPGGGRGNNVVYVSPEGERFNAKHYRAFRTKQTAAEQPANQAASVLDLPEPTSDKPAVETRKGGLATPQEIAQTFYILLLIATGLMAFFTHLPEVALTQDEAGGIAVPLGNILEKSQINKQYGQYLKNGGDYSLLGYGLYAYALRVGQQVQQRREYARQQGQSRNPAAPPVAGSTQTSYQSGGVGPNQPQPPGVARWPATTGLAGTPTGDGRQSGSGDVLSPANGRIPASGGIGGQQPASYQRPDAGGFNPLPPVAHPES